MSYHVFHRVWWRENKDWPNGLEPHLGRKTTIRKRVATEAEAQQICREWNATHDPGKFSRKAEYMEV